MRVDYKPWQNALLKETQANAASMQQLRKDGKKQHNELKKHVQDHSAATRGLIQAAIEESREQNEKASEADARTHNQNEKTHEELEVLKEANARTHKQNEDLKMRLIEAEERAEEAEERAAEDRKLAAEDRKRAEERDNRVEALMTSPKKQPNPEPANQGALSDPRNLFGAVPIVDDASTLTSEDDEDVAAKMARLELEKKLAETKRQLKDERERNQALTVPSGQVGLSEITPSVTNQTGRARDAEAKHVGAKTKRRQQDEQAKTMRTKRYVPAPTRRSTRSSSAKK